MNDVADLLEDQGQLEGSEALRRECAESRRTVLGETHPDTLATMNLGRPLGYFIFSLIGLKRTLFTNIFQRL